MARLDFGCDCLEKILETAKKNLEGNCGAEMLVVRNNELCESLPFLEYGTIKPPFVDKFVGYSGLVFFVNGKRYMYFNDDKWLSGEGNIIIGALEPFTLVIGNDVIKELEHLNVRHPLRSGS